MKRLLLSFVLCGITTASAQETKSRYARGEEHFFAGRIRESLVEWDAQVKEQPASLAGHWQRGLALYYADRFQEGRAQFEAHQKVNSEDVENAAWHFLCVAKSESVAVAQKLFIPITHDTRVPMREIHALYAGKGRSEDVLRAAEAKAGFSATALDRQLCYAHLYLGLYHEALGDAAQARVHLRKAAALAPAANYMGQVAEVHCMVRGWRE